MTTASEKLAGSAAVSVLRTASNPTYLNQSVRQLESALELRIRTHFNVEGATVQPVNWPELPPLLDGDTPFIRFVREQQLDRESQLLLLLAFAPCLRPDFFDRMIQKVLPGAGDFPMLGGVRGKQHRIETSLFKP